MLPTDAQAIMLLSHPVCSKHECKSMCRGGGRGNTRVGLLLTVRNDLFILRPRATQNMNEPTKFVERTKAGDRV